MKITQSTAHAERAYREAEWGSLLAQGTRESMAFKEFLCLVISEWDSGGLGCASTVWLGQRSAGLVVVWRSTTGVWLPSQIGLEVTISILGQES